MDYDADIGIWIPGSHIYRRSAPMASDIPVSYTHLIVCLVYGGVVSVFPVLVSDHFGMKYQGMNFGAVMLGYGLISILCPYLLDVAGLNTSFPVSYTHLDVDKRQSNP